MYSIIKPLLFKFDPEDMHHLFIKLGKGLGSNVITRNLVSSLWKYDHPSLHTTVGGVHFNNPVGLAAGFDKNGELFKILPSVGFGFMELGSFTGKASLGNAKPRLFRLPEKKTILVNLGLCNIGVESAAARLKKEVFSIPTGLSVAKTNDPNIKGARAIEDYAKGFDTLHSIGAYTTINVSCPSSVDDNTCTYGNPEYLPKLLKRLDQCKHAKPVFLKIKPDYSLKDLDKILKIAWPYKWVTGFIMGNLRKDRSGLSYKSKLDGWTKSGGLSGLPTKERSNRLLAHAYRKAHKRFVFIGCGGIFSAEDAYEKIQLGASLVQLVTGLIYEGPGLISKINKGLVELLKKDGFKNIEEAIGSKNGLT
ncbi:MAG TPA: quinone-dependent dihydroorotate dehydrogenase [Candidatus Nanoarchaeia archaeon]|nr:quinone-dependent dihydroorotate dehydrogenase [Candidatus Nanoarchaeia archaeon]